MSKPLYQMEVKGIVGITFLCIYDDKISSEHQINKKKDYKRYTNFNYSTIKNIEFLEEGTLRKKRYLKLYVDDKVSYHTETFEIKSKVNKNEIMGYVTQKIQQHMIEPFEKYRQNVLNSEIFDNIVGITDELIIHTEGIVLKSKNTNKNKLIINYADLIKLFYGKKQVFGRKYSLNIQYNTLNGEKQDIFIIDNYSKEKIDKILEFVTQQMEICGNKNDETFRYKSIECYIIEEHSVLFSMNQEEKYEKVTVRIMDDYLSIDKFSRIMNVDRGSKKILYRDITSIDYDRNRGPDNIELTISGSSKIILLTYGNEFAFKKFYDDLFNKFQEVKLNKNTDTDTTTVIQETSSADELLKWHNLYEQGIISEEEFNMKKKELLGL